MKVSDAAVDAIRAALEAAGVIFVEENGGGPGVRLRKAASTGDQPKPTGPASDVVEAMDTAIAEDRQRKKPKR